VNGVATVVPFGPSTSIGIVIVEGGGFDEVAAIQIVPLAVFVLSTTLVAVTVTVCALVTVAGAVYTPFAIVPTGGLIDQVTAVFVVPVTVALNVAACPAFKLADPGDTPTATGTSVTVALAVSDELAALVAVTVTVCWVAIVAGA
jgi:hypothetical protein